MKKVLSLLLAVVLVFSMATVAFAATYYPNVCKVCGATFDTVAEAKAHNEAVCDRICSYCGTRCNDSDDRDKHEKKCLHGSATCDYCGVVFSPIADHDEHLDACKTAHFNIPFAKIFAAIENFLKTTDWNDIVTKVVDAFKTVIEKVKPVVTDLAAKIPAEA